MAWGCFGTSSLTVATLAVALPLTLWPAGEVKAQCIGSPVQANQTCTNSGVLTNTSTVGFDSVGLQDLGTPTVTNTIFGTISGDRSGVFTLHTANVNNAGTISGLGSQGVGIFGGDAVNVTNSGTIAGSAANGTGISSFAVNLTNSGLVSGGFDAIQASVANVFNSGTIIGTQVNSYGLDVNTASVTNSGTIFGGAGALIASSANVSNSGIISASSANGVAIYAFNTAAVTNSGIISANAVDGIGIFASLTADVTNSGTISGDFAAINAATANVSNSGTISAKGSINAKAIQASQNANVINSGTIAANGFSSTAIGAGQDVNLTNSGVVAVSVMASTGIFAGRNINVNNSGTISADVISGVAMLAVQNADVTNSGVISANGVNGAAIDAIQSVNLINSGIVTANGAGSYAVLGGQDVSATNSGTISANGAGGVAVFASRDIRATNSGTISATGAGGIGIRAFRNADVINSGIISGGLAAIRFAGFADTLILLPGSRIIGAINLGGGGDTVNMQARNQNLTFDTLAGATVTGTVPFTVAGNRIASIDPTSFAAAGTVLTDFSRSVSAIVPVFDNLMPLAGNGVTAFDTPDKASRIADAFASIPGLSAYASDEIAYKSPTAAYADGTAVWGRGFGGRHIQSADGLMLRNTSTWFGGVMGVEKQLRSELRFGIFVGAGSTHNSIVPNGDATDSNLGFAGVYARYSAGASFLYAAVQGGAQRSTTSRLINNNLAPEGQETATAGYNGWYVSPEMALGHRFALGAAGDAQYAVTPSLQMRYLHAAFGGYTETGTTAPVTAASRTTGNIEERAELKLTRTTQVSPTSQLLINLSGGALGIQRVGGDAVNATLLAQPLAFTAPGSNDVWGGFAGLGVEFQSRNVALFAAGEYLALDGASSILSGRGGIRIGF